MSDILCVANLFELVGARHSDMGLSKPALYGALTRRGELQ
jgi:hypothetical protein